MVVTNGHPTAYTKVLSKHPVGRRILKIMLSFYLKQSKKQYHNMERIRPCVTTTKLFRAQQKK